MSLKAGTLNRRVVIQQPSTTQDEIGQPIPSWSEVATVYANVRYLNGVETIKADAETSIARASIRVRYRTDVTPAMRVLLGTTVFRIEAVLPDEGRKEHTDLVCEVLS